MIHGVGLDCLKDKTNDCKMGCLYLLKTSFMAQPQRNGPKDWPLCGPGQNSHVELLRALIPLAVWFCWLAGNMSEIAQKAS